jgi:3-hydroxybutyryl-CoA dehydrogenase
MTKPISKVAIIGSGFMGIQIAVRAILYGSSVRMFDVNKEALEKARNEIKPTLEVYSLEGQFKGDAEIYQNRVSYFNDLAAAVKDAELIIEIVPEKLELKREVFAKLDKLAPPSAIIATNSSSLPVSKIETAVSRRDKVANIHFYAQVMKTYFVDIAGGTETSKETMDAVDAWVKSIECLPLMVKKECMGFVFNRIWRAVKRESLAAWGNGNADFMDIDRAWVIWSGMPLGPFGMMDWVGLDVVYDIEMQYYLDSGDPKDRPPDALKAMIDRGELGKKSGKGFYDWKNPEFAKPDFLKPH